jgi:hypothetical protein
MRRLLTIEGETEEEDDRVDGVEASLEDRDERLTNIEILHKSERETFERAEKKKEAKLEVKIVLIISIYWVSEFANQRCYKHTL